MDSRFVVEGKSQLHLIDECQDLGVSDKGVGFSTSWTLCVCVWVCFAFLEQACDKLQVDWILLR